MEDVLYCTLAENSTGFPQKFHKILRQRIILRVGYAVGPLVDAPLYKSEGRGFDSR
jgi:hypothetical protein